MHQRLDLQSVWGLHLPLMTDSGLIRQIIEPRTSLLMTHLLSTLHASKKDFEFLTNFNSLYIEYSSPFDPPPLYSIHNSASSGSLEYVNEIEEDLDWFSTLCNSLYSQLGIETGELFGNLAEMLMSKIRDDECQYKLLYLMGFNNI